MSSIKYFIVSVIGLGFLLGLGGAAFAKGGEIESRPSASANASNLSHLIEASDRLNHGDLEPVLPINATGFYWEYQGNQTWDLNLVVREQALSFSRLKVSVFWNVKSYLEIVYDDDGEPMADLESHAVESFDVPDWDQPGEPTIVRGYTVYPDVSFLSYMGLRSEFNHTRGGITYSPRQQPYHIGRIRMSEGISYLGWLNNPLLFAHSVIQALAPGEEFASNPGLIHSGLHFVDANDDDQQTFEDYMLLWDLLDAQTYVTNFSLFQHLYDPRFDIDEDRWMNFVDLRRLGWVLNDNEFIGDTDGDADADQIDFHRVKNALGSALLNGDGSYDAEFPWRSDLNGDLVVDDEDLLIVAREVKRKATY